MENFLTLLGQVDRSADFAYFSDEEAFLPGIEIKSLNEEISLPLPVAQAQSIIGVAQQAPYGKGSQTLVDTSVRNCWEIDVDELTFHSRSWDKMVEKALRQAEEAFDTYRGEFEAVPYKLLLYEKGGFFLPHQDSEKIPDMVATLVICLPSKHEGGDLVISHGDDEFVFNTDDPQGLKKFQMAIFYADCQHELKPVLSGYRLCLIYNIRMKTKNGKFQLPTDAVDIVGALTMELKKWSNSAEKQGKLVVALEHQYSEENFCYENLKGVDRPRAALLLQAGKAAGLKSYLALINHYKCYSAYEQHYSRRRYWDDDEDYDEDDIEIGELIEDYLTLTSLQSRDGQQVMRSMPLKTTEILNLDGDWDIDEAIEKDYEGYTGNAGASMSYWYRFAAVVYWSESDEFELLVDADWPAAAQQVYDAAKTLAVSHNDEAKSLLTKQFKVLFKYFDKKNFGWGAYRKESSNMLFDSLVTLGHKPFLEKYVFSYAIELEVDWTKKRLSTLQELFGPTVILQLMKEINKKAPYGAFDRCLLLTKNLHSDFLGEHKAILKFILTSYKLLHGSDRLTSGLFDVVRLMMTYSTPDLLKDLIGFIKSKPQVFNVETIQLVTLEKIHKILSKSDLKTKGIFLDWLTYNRDLIVEKAGEEPEADYKPRIPEIPVNATGPLQELRQFMLDEEREEKDFRILKKYRLQLEEDIRTYDVDIETKFDPRPRPQSLLCLKKGAKQRKKIRRYKSLMLVVDRYKVLLNKMQKSKD